MQKFALIAVLGLLLQACGGAKEETPASKLYTQAETALSSKDYTLALSLVDSLEKAYPTETDLQRQAMMLRPKIMELLTIQRIVTIDSLAAIASAEAQNLKPQLKWVKTPQMLEGYWVAAKGYNPDFLNSTGIQGRVSEIGQFYIVSSLQGALKHTSISLNTNAGSATTPSVPYDGESNYRIAGTEVITFSPEQSDTIGQLAARGQGGATLSFNGAKSSKKIKLSPAQLQALALTYRYSQAVIGARQDAVERQKLDRQLQIARDQQARTSELAK